MKTVKISALILTGIVSSTIFITPLSASAKELNNYSNTTIQNEKQTNLSMEQAIHIVEKNYLSQNPNGTFSIKDSAINEIGEDLFYELTDGMEQVNQLISNKALQFYENGKIKKINNNIKESITPRYRASDAYGKILSSYKYCSNYNWYWWGFKTNVNKAGCSILSSEINKTIAYVATVSGGIAFLPGLKIPSAIGAGGITYWLVSLKTEFEKGTNARGATVTALGKPSNPQITDVTTRY